MKLIDKIYCYGIMLLCVGLVTALPVINQIPYMPVVSMSLIVTGVCMSAIPGLIMVTAMLAVFSYFDWW